MTPFVLVSGDFVTDFTSPTRERRHDGTFAGRENRVFPREVQVGFFGRVDPYASALVRISAGEVEHNIRIINEGRTEILSKRFQINVVTRPIRQFDI